jgi:thioredoxin reductase (NADPH)
MSVLTASSVDRQTLASRWKADGPLVVISLCAAWCHTCREFQETFERIAGARKDAQFVWLDIEDDHEICGDIDVESFPTLVVFRGHVPVHFGVSMPQEATVARLIDELASHAIAALDVPREILELRETLGGAQTLEDALAAIYSGAKAALRPIHDKVMDDVNRFGQFESVPKQSYVELRRTKPFALIGPATDASVEVGLNLESVDGAGRLLAMPPGSLCSHVVKLASVADANAELTAWIRVAYDAAG